MSRSGRDVRGAGATPAVSAAVPTSSDSVASERSVRTPGSEDRYLRICCLHGLPVKERRSGGMLVLLCPSGPHRVLSWQVYDRQRGRIVAVADADRGCRRLFVGSVEEQAWLTLEEPEKTLPPKGGRGASKRR